MKTGWMRRAAALGIAAALTLLASALVAGPPAAAQTGGWPAACVGLNDVVEAHLGNHGNVGIYQRAYGAQAEQACQNDHRADVQAAFAWALGGAGSAPTAPAPTGGWPATCLALNDVVEAHLGNHGNVGIYQRAYGAQAEQACQNDHRADVQAAFAWVGPATGAPTAPRNLRVSVAGNAVTTAADPPSDGGGLPLRGYRWSVSGATSRGGSVASGGGSFSVYVDDLNAGVHTFTVAAFNDRGDGPPISSSFTIDPTSTPTAPRNLRVSVAGNDVTARADPPSDGGGLPLRGYRWSISGATPRSGEVGSDGGAFGVRVEGLNAGEHTFTLQAFNDRGGGPPVSSRFTIEARGYRDPALQAALTLLRTVDPIYAKVIDALTTTSYVFDPLSPETLAAYVPAIDTIAVRSDLRWERTEALAALLAHEIYHALGWHAGNSRTREACFQEEIFAHRVQAGVWASFRWGLGYSFPFVPWPSSDLEFDHESAYADWLDGAVETSVRASSGYQEQCNRLPR